MGKGQSLIPYTEVETVEPNHHVLIYGMNILSKLPGSSEASKTFVLQRATISRVVLRIHSEYFFALQMIKSMTWRIVVSNCRCFNCLFCNCILTQRGSRYIQDRGENRRRHHLSFGFHRMEMGWLTCKWPPENEVRSRSSIASHDRHMVPTASWIIANQLRVSSGNEIIVQIAPFQMKHVKNTLTFDIVHNSNNSLA